MQGKEILKRLEEEIPESDKRYLKQIHFIEEQSKSDLIVFTAPNIYIANWIKRKYTERIIQLFNQNHGITPTIKVILKDAYKRTIVQPSTQIQSKKKTYLLDTSCKFENFIIGNSNRLAYDSALRVAKKQATYNPLLIYGGTGLGKTHLLNAIGNYVAHNKKINYITSEQFLNDFFHHYRNKTMERFKEKYRSSDYLLIDDVQFFARGEACQTEFFHTFNELYKHGKQIVLTSDQHPNSIAKLDERLKSRFVSGLVCDISAPDLETKIAIIKSRCEIDKVDLDKDSIYFIATNINSNIREICGIVIKLNAAANIIGQEITLEFVKNQLKDHMIEENKSITLDNIIDFTSKQYNVKPSEIKSKARNKNIVLARRIVIYLARILTPNSMPSLAQSLGMKDHSSVSKAYKAIEAICKKDKDFQSTLEELQNRIKSKN